MNKLVKRLKHNQDGFTLMELVLVILLVAILSGGMFGLYYGITNVFHSQSVRIQNQDDARLAMNQLTRYLRMAASSADNQTSQSNSIVSALPQSVEFYADVDGDSITEKIRYYVDGDSLRMQAVTPTLVTEPEPQWVYPSYTSNGVVIQNALQNVTNAIFRYYRYDENQGGLVEFSPTTEVELKQVVTVSISLTVNEKPHLAKGNVLLTTQVEIRQRYHWGLK